MTTEITATETVELSTAVPTAKRQAEAALQSAQLDLEAAQALTVTSADEADFAGSMANDLGKRRRSADELRLMHKRPVMDAAQAIDDIYNPIIRTLKQGEDIVKAKVGDYLRSERERAAAEARAAEEAAAAERRRLEQRAKRAEKREDDAKAEELRMQAAMVPAPVRRAPAKVAGVSRREVWDFEIESLPQLVAAVAQGRVPLEALKPDDTFIRRTVKAQRHAFTWPGVRAVVRDSIAGKG